MCTAAAPLLTAILLAVCVIGVGGCSLEKRYEWDIQRELGHGPAAWNKQIDDKWIHIETIGDDVFVQHGEHAFLFKDTPSFEGRYSYYSFNLLGSRLNAFYSPEGLTVRYQGGFEHWKMDQLPTGVKIVISGLDIRYEGLDVD